jgi:type IV pilus assembly protein PilQ
MDKQWLGVSGMGAAILVVAMAQGAMAQAQTPIQITDVRLSPTPKGVDVVLKTQGEGKPQIFNINNEDNSLTSYVFNARLAMAQPFRQENPAPGIAYVAVVPSGNNGVQIQVGGQGIVPTGQVTRRDAQGIVLSVTDQGAAGPAAQQQPDAIAQAGAPVPPLVPNPTVQTAPPAPAPVPVPPLRPRAVAPPVGDISVSQVDTTPLMIDLGTAERIPRLVLRDAPVREVLSLLARAAGLNIAYAEQPNGGGGGGEAGAAPQSGGPTISLDIENESVQDVFNYVLRIACVPITGGAGGDGGGGPQCASLEANLVGRTVFVGPRLPDDARDVISRTIRLNQVPASDAAAFLTTQGAESQRPFERVEVQTVGEGAAARTIETRTPEILALRANEGVGPLVLRGLSVSTNDRLNQITLTGTPKKVQVATSLLTQLDARKRQVAVNVKVVDVNLRGLDTASASFSFGVGDSFFSFDNGAALLNFGGVRPPSNLDLQNSIVTPPVTGVPLPPGVANPSPFLGQSSNAPFGTNNNSTPPPNAARPPFGTFDNPYAPGVTQFTPGTETPVFGPNGNLIGITRTPDQITYGLPTLFQYPSRFLARLQAQVVSGNAKLLTDPTVVIQEGERSKVQLTQDVITNLKVETTFSNNVAIQNVTVEKDNAGLTLDLILDRIDDNGFVTLSVIPQITAPVGTQTITGQGGNQNQITLLARRVVESGKIRLRDGQTLVLSGIIQESDRTEVSKVPILGDIPLLGALFRRTSNDKQRQEVIVLLTPRIVNDNDQATWGYGYNPSPEAQQMLRPNR